MLGASSGLVGVGLVARSLLDVSLDFIPLSPDLPKLMDPCWDCKGQRESRICSPWDHTSRTPQIIPPLQRTHREYTALIPSEAERGHQPFAFFPKVSSIHCYGRLRPIAPKRNHLSHREPRSRPHPFLLFRRSRQVPPRHVVPS